MNMLITKTISNIIFKVQWYLSIVIESPPPDVLHHRFYKSYFHPYFFKNSSASPTKKSISFLEDLLLIKPLVAIALKSLS